jgi:hypothetical protein
MLSPPSLGAESLSFKIVSVICSYTVFFSSNPLNNFVKETLWLSIRTKPRKGFKTYVFRFANIGVIAKVDVVTNCPRSPDLIVVVFLTGGCNQCYLLCAGVTASHLHGLFM